MNEHNKTPETEIPENQDSKQKGIKPGHAMQTIDVRSQRNQIKVKNQRQKSQAKQVVKRNS